MEPELAQDRSRSQNWPKGGAGATIKKLRLELEPKYYMLRFFFHMDSTFMNDLLIKRHTYVVSGGLYFLPDWLKPVMTADRTRIFGHAVVNYFLEERI